MDQIQLLRGVILYAEGINRDKQLLLKAAQHEQDWWIWTLKYKECLKACLQIV